MEQQLIDGKFHEVILILIPFRPSLPASRYNSVALTNGIDKHPKLDSGVVSGVLSTHKLKVLMLHGYTQSGELFHAKTRALEKLLVKHFSPGLDVGNTENNAYPNCIKLIYVTAPIRLSPSNIPGFNIEPLNTDEENDLWGWWTRDTDTNMYAGLEKGLSTIAHAIRGNNGVDAVIGFSQGAAAAALVASLLEPERLKIFEEAHRIDKTSLAFPEDWRHLRSLCPDGLKFVVAYSGFLPSHSAYRAFFEPKIQTPVLHFIGSLDSVVDESRTLALVEKFVEERRKLVYHPGGHFVPCSKQMVGVLIEFIRDCLAGSKAPSKS